MNALRPCQLLWLVLSCLAPALPAAGTVDVQPDPGFELSIEAADAIAEVEILAGGPFRAVAQTHKTLKGQLPRVFELTGYNSYNWDTAHSGFTTGSKWILCLSKTGDPDVFAPLTPAATRLNIEPEGVMLPLGQPTFNVPVKKRAIEEGITLLLERAASGQAPDRARAFLQSLWDEGELESRYLAVALSGALRDTRAIQLLIDASKDKLFKMRLCAIESLGKVATPPATAALRALLKDEKTTVAREAARTLVGTGDCAAVGELLEWVRRFAPKAPATNPSGRATAAETELAKTEQVALEVLGFTVIAGPLADRAALCKAALDIARSPSEALARAALQVVTELGEAGQVAALLELAEDRTYQWNTSATAALQRMTLKWFKDTAEFRRWWGSASAVFGENLKRDQIEDCAQSVLASEDALERRTRLDLLRVAPGEIALVSAAPLLLKSSAAKYFSADDFDLWRTPLALPFILERLGSETASERRGAIQALYRHCARHPRLKAALWPLLRAQLFDSDSNSRRMAQAAAGLLQQLDALPAILDSLQYAGGYESNEAGKAFYSLTLRTFGFSTAEPAADQALARQCIRLWWERLGARFSPTLRSAYGLNYSAPDEAAATLSLDVLVRSTDSRTAGAAFGVLLSQRQAADPLWRDLSAQTRQRDRAHGLLGMIGADAPTLAALGERFKDEAAADSPLCRALNLLVLGAGGKVGGEQLTAWCRGAGAQADPVFRRLAIVLLGLADGEPQSLALLGEVITSGVAEKPNNIDRWFNDPPPEDPLLRAALTAACARSDATALLVTVLEKSASSALRDHAARALSARRAQAAVPGILAAIKLADRYEWPDFCRMLDPLLREEDVATLRTMIAEVPLNNRCAGVYLLAQRPELGPDAQTQAALLTGLDDPSTAVRCYAAEALGKRDAQAAADKLMEALKDEDEDVRANAAEALGRLKYRPGCALASELAPRERRIDSRWLRALAVASNDEALAILLKLCDSTAYVDQRGGLAALGASDHPKALARLLKTFRNDDAAMQTVACDALAEHRNEALTAVAADLRSPERNTRARALLLLSKINTPAAQSALKQAAQEPDPALRDTAEFLIRRQASPARGASGTSGTPSRQPTSR